MIFPLCHPLSTHTLQLTKKTNSEKNLAVSAVSNKQQNLNAQLYNAVLESNTSLVVELLSSGADPNTICPKSLEKKKNALSGATAFITAAHLGNMKLCEVLIQAGANQKLRDSKGLNALLHAGYKKRTIPFTSLLSASSIDENTFDDLYVVEQYVKEFSQHEYHSSYAFEQYINALVDIQLKKKINLTKKDKHGNQLIHYVARWASPSTLKKLIVALQAKKISLDQQNDLGKTPLHRNLSARNCEILLEYGANVNALDKTKRFGKSPLYWACKRKKTSLELPLINYGADLSLKLEGETLLQFYLKHTILDDLGYLVFTPSITEINHSYNIIKTFLLCCKRYCPSLPRDMRYLLLLTLDTHDLGYALIGNRLRGKTTPIEFDRVLSQVLYETSLHHLVNQLEALKNKRTYLEETIKELLHETIQKRLSKPKLYCNNPSQVFN